MSRQRDSETDCWMDVGAYGCTDWWRDRSKTKNGRETRQRHSFHCLPFIRLLVPDSDKEASTRRPLTDIPTEGTAEEHSREITAIHTT